MPNKDKAVEIQKIIDDRWGLDISSIELAHIVHLRDLLTEFLAAGVDTDDLDPV